MGQEVELKLTLPESEQKPFLRGALLRQATEQRTEQLRNVYYDSSDLALHCNGIALRLRRSGRNWLQTVKCTGISQGGLSSRPEWEVPYIGRLDFSAIGDSALRKRLERLMPRLVPIFETNFRRRTWTMRRADATVLVALDRGSIVAADRKAPISEVEIELVQGDLSGLFGIADELAHRFTLVPYQQSKAERGYRLFLDIPDHPAHATAVSLDGTMSLVAAFRCIAFSCLDHLQQNYEGAIRSDDIEFIHQMRVALRRLRAVLRLFRRALPARIEGQLLPPMRDLMVVLGAVRDLDVLTAEIVAPALAALPDEPRLAEIARCVAERRHAARERAVAYLRSPAYGRLLLDIVRTLNELAADKPESGTGLAEFVHSQLKRQRRRIARLAHAAGNDEQARLHALRIGVKRMRYAVEFFTPLLRARRAMRFTRHMMRLQDDLGQINDLANAGAVLTECAGEDPPLREAVSLIGGWHGERYAKLVRELAPHMAKLLEMRLPKAR